ncbi:ABC transporter ATP-binding protein [Actinosynnema sp. ALI-1.44]|uniref:ABC transporter ATP-binding protein n=1 Tax=Actinosynnema sp. ALI-1.44 TaxID=1933779 RepID=UPI00097C705C|nr:ABC transporter ATP-binding protein [Actinosynnema sp. ALI-1.44]ONI83188.1 ABC transporter ATP-binding protein [Actinosynnema sp. ALI-1.44]
MSRPVNPPAGWRSLWHMARPQRPRLAAAVALCASSSTLAALAPLLLGHATDLVFTAKPVDFAAVGRTLLLVTVVYAAAAALNYLGVRLAIRVVENTLFRLREHVAAKLTRLPPGYVDEQSRGDLISRVTNDVDNLGQVAHQTIGQVINSLFGAVAVLTMMLLTSPLLALITVITVPVALVTTRAITRRARPCFAAQWKATGALTGYVEEMYTGHSTVTLFDHHEKAAEEFREHNDEVFANSYKAQFRSGLVEPAMMFIGNLNYVFIAVAGGLQVASGSISIGTVQAFLQYSRNFAQPLTQMASISSRIQSGAASANRVFELLDAAEQTPDPAAAQPPAVVRGDVVFDRVSFRYSPDQALIEDMSLTVAAGDLVAIVGPTGAGKTTVVNLLMRFCDTTAGRITVDGADITAMSRADLRSHIAMVAQEPWLFRGTIAENIAYGKANATREQIEAAARAARVDHFARTLPDGYDTIIDDDVSAFSAGERQLITIARAFIADPAILVLDEATSSVDTRTDALIQQAIADLRTGRTSFVVAHRLSTVRAADTILVMRSGTIVEQGTHEDLLAAEGTYSRLHAS